MDRLSPIDRPARALANRTGRGGRRFRAVAFGLLGCVALATLGAQVQHARSGDGRLPSADLDQRIASHLREWLRMLEWPGPVSPELAAFMGDARLEAHIRGRTLLGREALLEWAAQTNRGSTEIRIGIGLIETKHEGDDLVDAHFDVRREARDEGGLMHLTLDRHSWRIRLDDHSAPILLSVDAQPAIPHPGTGTKILCL